MRIFIVIVAISALLAWRAPETVSADVSAPPPGADASAAAQEPEGTLLPPSLASLWGERKEPQPPPDPVVHCRLDEGDTFVRRSTCERAGGWPDEPGWARLD